MSLQLKELAQAYEVLINPEKREIYDQYEVDTLKEGTGGGGGGHDPFDIFSSFFGGGSPFGARRWEGPKEEAGWSLIEPRKGVIHTIGTPLDVPLDNGEATRDGDEETELRIDQDVPTKLRVYLVDAFAL
ncbi:unnamed protein product [Microthlaspi erraticum]|uniref:J domain-containing protein n=1 Tax=Microthlaspi erraticum TaxID=1685480 RepID=A0A6D2ICJ9_9BRAS|nr:unnamed protein product [Microthlaspi erraticum]